MLQPEYGTEFVVYLQQERRQNDVLDHHSDSGRSSSLLGRARGEAQSRLSFTDKR